MTQGLGLDAVLQLAATGKYHVIIGSRSLSNAEAAIEEIAKDESLKFDCADVEAVQIDVTSDESIAAAAKTIEEKHGYLDILMLNAGQPPSSTE
jgi:NAD(P)-dependent dehydrogenase (short-subunit alcohol dehydrogenase family)